MTIKGFSVYEELGLGVINMSRQPTSRVFETRLEKNAFAIASYYGDGVLHLDVMYSDNPIVGPLHEARGTVRARLGEFRDGRVESHKEERDTLREVELSYAEPWKAFLEALPAVLLAAQVMKD